MGLVSAIAQARLPPDLRRGLRRELLLADERIAPGEAALDLGRGEHAGRRGIVLVTDRRLVFLARSRPAPALQECPYALIAQVQILDDTIRIVDPTGGGASVTMIRPDGRAAEIGELVERLVRLEELRGAGLLGEAEMARERARLGDGR